MRPGEKWASEQVTFTDSISGIQLTQLTKYRAHSFHLYFTNCGWYDSDSKLLIVSDRGNSTNLFSVNLANGELTQVTDLDPKGTYQLQGTYINPQRDEAYYVSNKRIVALNLKNYEERVLYERPGGYRFGNVSCTADGALLCFGLVQDLSHVIKTNLSGGYVGFEETEARRPHSQICLLSLTDGQMRVIHEEKRWIGHVNTSPTQPHLLSFCHEGPWDKVDHRIWAMNVETGDVWKVREGLLEEYAGHEYWHADGLHIGYHGFTESLERKDGKFLGFVKFDNTEGEEFQFPYQNMHIHSNHADLIVGDGQQASAYHGERFQDCIFLWRRSGDKMEGPRILCKHRGSFHVQQLHVHPRFSPDGRKVLFTSDMSGYGNVYLVDVPPFESLPEVNL